MGSKAGQNNKSIFFKYIRESWRSYIENIKTGELKINLANPYHVKYGFHCYALLALAELLDNESKNELTEEWMDAFTFIEGFRSHFNKKMDNISFKNLSGFWTPLQGFS